MARSAEIQIASPEIKEFELSGETALIVHCARLHLSGPRQQAVKDILAAGVDWESLLKNAFWQRLTPLVSYHLRSPDFNPLVPEPITARLKAVHYQSLARNMLLQDELGRILSAFNKEGIPVIVLKGAALLDTVYRDISLRPMSDLDILVRPEDLKRAEALVLRLDYVYVARQDNGNVNTENRHLPNLAHRKKGIPLELHQHIVNADDACYFDIARFWARAQPVRKNSAEALVFSPEDLLAHLSIKFLLDRRYQSMAALGQLCDISEIINHYNGALDWDLIARTARENGFAAGLYGVLYGCQSVLGTSLPAEFMHRLRPAQFNMAVMDLFLRRRVLDSRPWLAHDLVDYDKPYNLSRMLGAILGRSSRLAAEAFGSYEPTGKRRFFASVRFKNILPRLFRSVLKPSELKEDLLLDRWLHDLFQQT